jgi:adenine deaminase
MPKAPLADRIDQGRGQAPADLVLKGGRVFDLITGDLVETDVAICGDTIVGVFGSYGGKREIDVSGRCWFRASSTRICTWNRRW